MRFPRLISSTLFTFSFLLVMMQTTHSVAVSQDSLNKQIQNSPEKYFRRSALTDSLTSLLLAVTQQQDSLRELLKTQKASIKEAELVRVQLAVENTNLKQELNGAKGDKLQSSHTKSILFIFNLIVGIFLLIAVIWMFMRKKSEPASKIFANTATSTFSATPTTEGYDHKLERIEKLGNLREKGLLTEDEFNLQKRQILGDRN